MVFLCLQIKTGKPRKLFSDGLVEEDSCTTATCLQIEAILDDASKLMETLRSGEELPGEETDYSPDELQAVHQIDHFLKKQDRLDKGFNEYLKMQHAELIPDINLKKPPSQSCQYMWLSRLQ